MNLPSCETLLLHEEKNILFITLNRPEARNALSVKMTQELMDLVKQLREEKTIRAVVLRGSQGYFCAGADIKDTLTIRQQSGDVRTAIHAMNRSFGELITVVNHLPQVVVAVVEGIALGGGFGLACVADVTIALETSTFGMPETSLGILPAQIAPFVVQRIGLSQARRLALLSMKFKGTMAKELGIVHEVFATTEALDQGLQQVLQQIKKCAPGANAATKKLMLSMVNLNLDNILDRAAEVFTHAVMGEESQEGSMAFVQKRLPPWAE